MKSAVYQPAAPPKGRRKRSRARLSSSPRRLDPQARTVSVRKRPQQRRAQETVDAILAAAAEVIATLGYAGATTNKIAARAGVSIGSLYQYFPNKDALLMSLLEQHHERVRPVIDQALAELSNPQVPLDTAIRGLFVRLVEVHEAEPQLTKVLSEEVPHPPHGSYSGHHDDERDTQMAELVLRARPNVRPGNRAVMAHVVVQSAAALSRWLVHNAPASLDKRAFIDEAVVLLTRYVLTD